MSLITQLSLGLRHLVDNIVSSHGIVLISRGINVVLICEEVSKLEVMGSGKEVND